MSDSIASNLSKNVLERIQEQVDSGQYEGKTIEDLPLAKHHNATPYPTQYFQSINSSGAINHVIALRITYDMNTIINGVVQPAAFQTDLQTEDLWRGEVNESAPILESDIVPYKPFCDVLVINAISKALDQGGQSSKQRRWRCGISLYWKDAQGRNQQWKKVLGVTGPRIFTRFGLQDPEPCDGVAIEWTNAYGGQHKTPATEQRNKHGEIIQAAGAKRWVTDERNPVGKGLDSSTGAAAPQLELEGQPYTANGNQRNYPPMGLSAVGKAWLPRRQFAGTYDSHWLENQWPLPPQDFNERYWNCAPQDQ